MTKAQSIALAVTLGSVYVMSQSLHGSYGAGISGVRESNGPPQPYEFSYTSGDQEGTYGHSQKGDTQGRVQGQYTIQLSDGRTRTVHYTADESGYRADIQTNEIGTESKDPADVKFVSSAITGKEAAFQASTIATGHNAQPYHHHRP